MVLASKDGSEINTNWKQTTNYIINVYIGKSSPLVYNIAYIKELSIADNVTGEKHSHEEHEH